MKLEIRIFDDNEQVVAEYKGDPSQPGGWRALAGQRLVSHMPAQSDNQNTGTYELYGFTYQPHLRVDRPNGYTAPVPSPNNGQSPNFPTIAQAVPPKWNSIPPSFLNKPLSQKSPWSPMVPTVSPSLSATNSPQEVK